jgi:hypothetical protein
MANELEEMVSDNIEDIGVDAVIERQREQTHSTPRWEGWVALSSSLLAVLSAVAALYATFAADEAAIAESQESVVAAYASGAEASYNVMRAKVDILKALGKPIDTADETALQAQARHIQNYRLKSRQFDQTGVYEYKTHDQLTIAVIVQRPALWVFGISFMAGGALFMGYGLVDFFT